MKMLSLLGIVTLSLLAPLGASIGEKHLEAEKKNAEEKGKALVYFFAQGYYNPNCPKCIADVNANNAAMRKALPRKVANVIMIDAGETRGLDKLPACVTTAKQGAPQLIATDAAGTTVIATLQGRPDRKQADAFAKALAAAIPPK